MPTAAMLHDRLPLGLMDRSAPPALLFVVFLSSFCFFAEVGPVQLDDSPFLLPPPPPPHPSGQPEVVIDSGRVRGLSYTLPHLGVAGDAFLGIPFAEPPVDRLRFQLPVPVKPWPREKVLNATAMPNSCHQSNDTLFGSDFDGSNMWNPNTHVDEDCLFLNVWVPRGSAHAEPSGGIDDKKRAVMIWIFGGGFYSGTTTLEVYDGRILASLHNVILVSIGYRVGALGFLCLDHPSAPCNVGLFDQRLGLDWVKRNIRAFGGDPDNVTLFGESAGSVSVSLHLLSPLSWDLFHRAIMQSGTANMPWATVTKDEGMRGSKEVVFDYIRCNKTNDTGRLADCLRKELPQRLVDEQWVSRGILQFPFLPVVDNNFLKESPSELLRLGRFKKCPILLGSNFNEGSWFIIYELFPRLTLTAKDMSRADFSESMEKLFYTFPQYPQKLNSSFAMDAIKFQYTDWLNPDDADANLHGLDAAVGDFQFICPLNEFALSYASAGQTVYMYYFTQRYSSNPWPDWMGGLHGDEVLFTFGQPLKPGRNFAADERELSRTIMNYWTNFAQTG